VGVAKTTQWSMVGSILKTWDGFSPTPQHTPIYFAKTLQMMEEGGFTFLKLRLLPYISLTIARRIGRNTSLDQGMLKGSLK